ncbi:MAG: Gfo/Idh/MocA family oxidoreductase [Planctomycetota bacterium]|nr:Gfo/Idh/MocA family oxidoreductase [Planctomycetota bacterium]
MGISIGMVGLGAFGKTFVSYYKAHPLVSRIGLCDREPERIAQFVNDPFYADKFKEGDAYGSLDEILKADFDALVVITQPWLHAEQCVRALEHGKHVYSAVPIVSLPCADEILDWCDKLVNTSRRTGKKYMLGETSIFHPETMYCRRQARAGAFGSYVFAEGQYYHDVDSPGCNLRDVQRHRLASTAGREWVELKKSYDARGIRGGPMHYPTHSTGGPLNVMQTYALKASCIGQAAPPDDAFFSGEFGNETGFFKLANGATMRINEYRRIGFYGEETFNLYGTEGSFRHDHWVDKRTGKHLTLDEMRDPLPREVYDAFLEAVRARQRAAAGPGYQDKDFSPEENDRQVFGGHRGSHAFLVHEFVSAVAADRQPITNAWEAARYMACGAVAHKSALRDGEWLPVPDWGAAPGA